MNKVLTISIFCTLAFYHAHAQILPKENSKLNYRLVGFSFPMQKGVMAYKVEIATGYYNNADSFKDNVVKTCTGDENKIISEVPEWGKAYTWRAVYTKEGKETKSPLYHFTTDMMRMVDTNSARVRVIKAAEKYKDAYIMADGTGVLYDMSGNALWYLPGVQDSARQRLDLMDMRLTGAGTVTYIHNDQVYEADYNGKILWQGPNTGEVSKDKIENYHHEFFRTSKGHYMVMGREYVLWNTPMATQLASTGINKPQQQNLVFGTLIEYDQQGHVVWTWRSSDYAKNCDLYNIKTGSWLYELNDIHDNAFFFDEENKVIYVSFKNINRIIKIKYPGGELLNTYGEIFLPNTTEPSLWRYCHQHSCKRSREGYLYLYNNNDCIAGALPKLMMFREPVTPADTLQEVWEYQCIMNGEGDAERSPGSNAFSGGGNVTELPGGEIFASMDSRKYNKAFIVDKNKKELWSVLFEQWDPIVRVQAWRSVSNYRVSIITDRKALERLVWNQEQSR